MLNILIGAIKVVFLLATLIGIHEFGHFIVAKLFKIKVHKFSIGFGPKIFHKKGKETEYSLRLIPLGGFVQLEGEDEESDDERSFSSKPIWQRILVLLAGVTVNITFAIIIYLSIYMNINYYVIPKISSETDASVLANYGLEAGDTIDRIDGKKVYNDFDVSSIISDSSKESFTFTVIKKDGSKVFKNVKIEYKDIGYVGLAFNPDQSIAYVVEGAAGEKAGLKVNDKIISIDATKYENVTELVNAIRASGGKELSILLLRDSTEKEIKLIPEATKKKSIDLLFETVSDVDFFTNMSLAWNETKCYLRATVDGLLSIFKGKTENVEFTGIVGISSEITKTESASEFFYLMSAISLSLGIMNLLPIPGLDGGKILICLIEAVRGKPISKSTEGMITFISFAILMFLMIYITIGDISKLIS